MRRFGILLLSVFGIAIVVGFVILLAAVFAVRGSLPPLDGERTVAGLRGPASLERDSLGVAVVRADSWADAQFVLGFAHGQDRFFQMDLTRRLMAGTLSELVGPGALDQDEALHDYGYDEAARLHLVGLSAAHREALDAYVQGVNAGRRSLGRRPPEYLLLRHRPEPWTAEDSLLSYLYFYNSLSVHYRSEAQQLELFRVLPEPVAEFLTLETSRFDQPLPALAGGSPTGGYTPAVIPPPWILDLRESEALSSDVLADARSAIRILGDPPGGSNAWATGVDEGAALVAGDPHMGISVPGPWYRAELHGPGTSIRGVSVPGIPGILAGMSDRVAWSPTAAQVDQTDLVELTLDADDPTRYLAPEGSVPFRIEVDTLLARSASSRVVERRVTHWGPVVATSSTGQPLALRSPAFDGGGLTLDHLDIGRARNVPEVVEIGRRVGGAALGLIMGDAEGRVGWMVTGVLPARRGTDGRRPTPGDAGSVTWTGTRPESERPVVVDSTGGYLFTANQRFAGLERSRGLSGAWAPGTRARRIAALLAEDARPSERLHQGYQLDTRSLEHEEVRDFLMDFLSPDESQTDLRRLREQAESWSGRADAVSTEFLTLLVAGEELREAALAPLVALVRLEVPSFSYRWWLAHEPAFRILEEQPAHLLPPPFESWDDYLREALERAADRLRALGGGNNLGGGSPFETPWGEVNRARFTHPFSAAQSGLRRFLDLPSDPLDGWVGAIRAQTPTYGQSFRFVGRPGRPETALLDVAGGQSGHPLSEWYAAGHLAWVEGRGAPLAAGPPRHRLDLVPEPPDDP
jgi:penicillin G amidase